MKYCPICKSLAHDGDNRCPVCGKKLSRVTDINEPVRLCIVGGTERAMLCGLLDDAEIPYLQTNVQPQGVANEIVTGFDVKLSNIAVLVPFQALPEASELLSSIETVNNPVEPMMDEINAHIEYLRANPDANAMSPGRARAVKIITLIIFLLLVAGAVFATDAFTGWIKGLFGG